MNEVVQLDLAGASSFMLEDDGGSIDGLTPLSESEWANLFLTLGSSDDVNPSSSSAQQCSASSPALPFEWDYGSSSSYADEMEMASTSTIISMPPPFASAYASPASAASTSPSSPESGAESSPQSSPQTSPYNDFLFSLPVLAIKDEISPLLASSGSSSALPSIEPFPPRSPIFELQPNSSYAAPSMAAAGNVGVAAPIQIDIAKTSSSSSSSIYGQPLARLAQPAGSTVMTAMSINPKKAQDLDEADVTGKKRRRADDPQQTPAGATATATATAVPSEIAAATSGVMLPRDTLLKLSSTEMEAYLQTLKSSRELTHAEERQLKKQLRLIKNREYAQESRKKKKSAHQEREGELSSLRTQNNELRTHNSALQSEVVLLNSKLAAVTSENTRLRAALRQMQHFHHQSKKNANNKRQRGDDSFDGAPSSPSSWFSLGLGSASVQSPKAAVTGGVCLLAVAFFALSFLLQGPGMFGSSPVAYGDVDWSRSTSRAMLEEGETTTYIRRSVWTVFTPTTADTRSSTTRSSSSSSSSSNFKDSEPNAADEKGVAKCGHDNMCYLYADKAHHVKTAERDPAGLQRDAAASAEILQRQNLTHHAIPIPVH